MTIEIYKMVHGCGSLNVISRNISKNVYDEIVSYGGECYLNYEKSHAIDFDKITSSEKFYDIIPEHLKNVDRWCFRNVENVLETDVKYRFFPSDNDCGNIMSKIISGNADEVSKTCEKFGLSLTNDDMMSLRCMETCEDSAYMKILDHFSVMVPVSMENPFIEVDSYFVRIHKRPLVMIRKVCDDIECGIFASKDKVRELIGIAKEKEYGDGSMEYNSEFFEDVFVNGEHIAVVKRF